MIDNFSFFDSVCQHIGIVNFGNFGKISEELLMELVSFKCEVL